MFESCYPDMENIWLDSVVAEYQKNFGAQAEVIIDVGTRDGDDAAFLAEKLGASCIVAIDANPIAYELTKSKYPEMLVLHTAVSDYIGTTSFMQVVSDDAGLAGCSSIDAKKIRTEDVFRGITNNITVPVTTMGEILRRPELIKKKIDVLKIDVEGFAYQVLAGLGNNIENVKVLHIETETYKVHPEHKDNIEVFRYMQQRDFVLVDVSYEWGYIIQDQVWINKRLIV